MPRLLARRVAAALDSSPVVVVTGARQAGKSTLVRALRGTPNRLYLTLDDIEIRGDAETVPHILVRRAKRLTLDEVQHMPAVLVAIKRVVDERRRPGQFLLTGSANLLLMRRVAETLAGRAVYLTLWPMTLREQRGLGDAGPWGRLFEAPAARWREVLEGEADGRAASAAVQGRAAAGGRGSAREAVAAERQAAEFRAAAHDWRAAARRGGYPTPALGLAEAAARDEWFAGYTATYLERDVLQLSAIHQLVEFRRLMRAACLRLGGLINQAELGRDVGLPQPTVHRYLAMLETSYQLVRLPAYAVNRTKRLIKAPKLYWSDTGLAMHLAGERAPRGAHLENLVLTDLLAWASGERDRPEILYWRTAAGEEVDFVVEWRGRLLAIEVKAGARVSSRDARGIQSFRAEYGKQAIGGLLVYTGRETFPVADGVWAVPWGRVV